MQVITAKSSQLYRPESTAELRDLEREVHTLREQIKALTGP